MLDRDAAQRHFEQALEHHATGGRPFERGRTALAYGEFLRRGRRRVDARAHLRVHLFWAETDLVFHARKPFPPGGVIEDPATGAAAAAFGGYLRSLGLVDAPARITILQGVDMGRPSRLLVDVLPDDRRVQVTGTAAVIASVGVRSAEGRLC